MQKSSFCYLDTAEVAQTLPKLFEILHANMSAIAPTGNRYHEDEACWMACLLERLEQVTVRIV